MMFCMKWSIFLIQMTMMTVFGRVILIGTFGDLVDSVQLWSSFLDKIGLTSVWERFPVSYTHIHTDHLSTSTLDQCLVNEWLIPLIADNGVLHFGDNLSRHSLILLKLNLGVLPNICCCFSSLIVHCLVTHSIMKKYTAPMI